MCLLQCWCLSFVYGGSRLLFRIFVDLLFCSGGISCIAFCPRGVIGSGLVWLGLAICDFSINIIIIVVVVVVGVISIIIIIYVFDIHTYLHCVILGFFKGFGGG